MTLFCIFIVFTSFLSAGPGWWRSRSPGVRYAAGDHVVTTRKTVILESVFFLWWVGLELCFFFVNFGSVQDVSYCRPIRFEYFGEEMNIYQHGVDFFQLFVVIYGPPPVNRPVPPSDPNLDHFEKRILWKNYEKVRFLRDFWEKKLYRDEL